MVRGTTGREEPMEPTEGAQTPVAAREEGPGRGVGRRSVAKSAALTAALLLAGRGVAQARPARRPDAKPAAGGDLTVRLPAPTGPHRIGSTTLHLVDRSRRDPWQPEIPVRELMVTILYPARAAGDAPPAPQMTRDAAARFPLIDAVMHPELPGTGVNWAATLTHARTGAPAQTVRRPVLLYTPGGGDPRTLGTGLAEELAGHGCVVVTIDHPGDASEVDFPEAATGRDTVRETVFRGDPRRDPRQFRTAVDTRVADVRYVLDQLELTAAGRNPDASGRPLPAGLGRALDLRRIGVYGHSAGGTTAAQALYEDHRLRAAVNLEGYLDHPPERPGSEGELFPVARYGVDRPMLMLQTDGFPHRAELERSWAAVLAHSHGRTRRGQFGATAHGVFTDYAAFAPQLQAAGLMTAEERIKLVGASGPDRSIPLVRRAVRSFFARQLSAP
ncbi:alpha/beta hydrolase [Streptomyces sp. NPDC093589]|uniref:alpha/beta hydrolase n=1 Tax=Streptomyces sp. NPDC093589 TaxID=3366043 RepID=UPI0037FB18E1